MLAALQINQIAKICRYLLILALVIYCLPALAGETTPPPPPPPNVATGLSAQSMLVNIGNQIPALMRMVTAIGYVLGMYFIFFGILKLKQYGESRTMMSQQHSLAGPIVYMIVGACLLYLPTTVHVGMSTFWTEPNPYGYEDLAKADQWMEFLNTIFVIIQFFGVVAFIRGLIILTQMGNHQQGVFGKGLTHIIGGIFCINIYQFVQVILITLGLPTW